MKINSNKIKAVYFLIILFVFQVNILFSQEDTLKKIFDRFGNNYRFDQIKEINAYNSCVAGFFKLHFVDGDPTNLGFNDNTLGAQRRAVACQVFTDLSRLISPALDPYTNTATVPLVHIKLSSCPASVDSGVLGGASSYYYADYIAGSNILEGQVWKTINGGINAWRNEVPYLCNAYHGYIEINFLDNSNYHYNLQEYPSISNYDFYSVLLHEAIHLLGFNSFINEFGISITGNSNCYYFTRYDSFLKTINNIPLITMGGCNSVTFTGPITSLTTQCSVKFDGTNPQYIYTPNNFAQGTSMSHLDNSCGSGLNYLMAPSSNMGIIKRHPLQEEVKVLNDLGYNTTTDFGYSTSGIGVHSTYLPSNNNRIAGVNDYHPFNSSLPYEINQGESIQITDFLENDEDNGFVPIDYECETIVYPNGGTLIGDINSLTYTPPSNFIGIAMIKYTPIASNGKKGNDAMVFINVMPWNCTPSYNLVCNGDFECITDKSINPLRTFSYDCGNNSPDLMINNLWRGLYSQNQFNYCTPVADHIFPHDYPNKHKYVLMAGCNGNKEAIFIKLNSSMYQSNIYRFSFWAASKDFPCSPVLEFIGSTNRPCIPAFNKISTSYSCDCGSYVYNPVMLTSQLINSSTWQQYTVDVTIPVGADINYVVITPIVNDINVLFDDFEVIPINSFCTGGTTLSGTISTSPPANSVYVVNNEIQISGNVTFTASEFKMGYISKITVLPNATLNILGSHLYSCGDMWNGITVQPGGRLNINSTTYNGLTYTPLIEDAITAVEIQGGSTLTTNILNVTNTTFNRNKTSISIRDYFEQISPYPFNISNSVFTCRDIPFTPNSLIWPLTSSIKANNNPTSSPLETPYINNNTYSQSNANAFLKIPYSGKKSGTAIELVKIGKTINASTSPTYYEIKIGATGTQMYNVFDNQNICINATDVNLTCVNSIFQNTILISSGHGYTGSIGIQSKSNEIHRLQCIPAVNSLYYNKFYNCVQAITSENYFENIIKNCDFRSTQNNSSAPMMQLYQVGRNGIKIYSDRFRNVTLLNNKLYNIESPIIFNALFGSFNIDGTYYSNRQYSGNVNINTNTIRPHLSGYAVTNQYISTAISVNNIITSYVAIDVPNSLVNINGNNITSAYRGIQCSNWLKKDIVNNNNTITLVSDPFNLLGTTPQYGISHSNNIANSNLGININSNTITGFNTTYQYCNAIITSLCNNGFVNCNNVSTTYRGLAFNGNQLPMQTSYNTMRNHRYGFVLDNSGVIGTQGSLTAPCDNVYTQPYASNWPTGSFFTATLNNSSSQNSKMYVRQTGYDANPDGYGTAILPSIYATDRYSSSNGSLIWATGSFIGCLGGGGGTTSMSGMGMDTEALDAASQENISLTASQSLENLLNAMDEFEYTTAEEEFIAQNQTYRVLKATPALMTNSTPLQQFFAQCDASEMGVFSRIEDKLSQGDFASSQQLINTLQEQNTVSANYKKFYQFYLKYRNDSVSPADSLTLLTLTNLCPFTGGAVVYQARALFAALYSPAMVFADNCDREDAKNQLRKSNIVNEKLNKTFNATIYPNPNNGSIFVSVEGMNGNDINIEFSDLFGRIIQNNKLLLNEGVGFINVELPNGIYLMKITDLQHNQNVFEKVFIQH